MQDGVLDPRSADAEERAALRAWLALQEAGWRRPVEARAALAQAPDPEAALRLLPGARPASAERLERHRAVLARLSALAVPFGARAYPPRLRELCDAAPLLLVRGDPAALSQSSVAIVGSRAATAAGRETARSLAADLAALGFCVVSGLARGIDAAAHRGALEAGGRSVALLGCGLDVVYPSQHLDLYQEIEARGALVSECPPSTEPLPYHFPLRNRLISGLAQVVVVVEARERSGSLTTAQHAIDQHRGLLVVPGAVDSLAHRGSNPLLRDSARVLLETDDVLRELGLSHHAHVASDPEAEILPSPARAVMRALREEPATPDELARRLGRPPEAVAADLVGLELAGLVERERDGRLRARRTRENPRGLDSRAGPGGRGG